MIQGLGGSLLDFAAGGAAHQLTLEARPIQRLNLLIEAPGESSCRAKQLRFVSGAGLATAPQTFTVFGNTPIEVRS